MSNENSSPSLLKLKESTLFVLTDTKSPKGPYTQVAVPPLVNNTSLVTPDTLVIVFTETTFAKFLDKHI